MNEILEIQKEETEQEITEIDKAISHLTIFKDSINRAEVRKEFDFFVQRLQEDKNINENLLSEIEGSIEFTRTFEA